MIKYLLMDITGFEKMAKEFTDFSTSRHQNCRPSKEMYFFIPSPNEIIEFNEQNKTKTLRKIFEGAVEFIDYEKTMMSELNSFIEKHNRKEKKKQVLFPMFWEDHYTLRVLQASSYDLKKCVEQLVLSIEFMKKTLPSIKPTNKIIEILNSGCIYVHGRDKRFRPNFYLRPTVYKAIADKYSAEEFIHSIIYLIEYVIKNMLIPGQVENWNLWADMTGLTLTTIPTSFKTIVKAISDNYRCRLLILYFYNLDPLIKTIFNMIKLLLDPVTVTKIKIVGKGEKDIVEMNNKSQLEEQFGGSAKDLTQYFFPPVIPSNQFFLEEEDASNLLISEEKYLELVKGNKKYVKNPHLGY